MVSHNVSVSTGDACESQTEQVLGEERHLPHYSSSYWLFEAIVHWVTISDSLPWLCPPLLGLAAGVVDLHRSDSRGERQAGLV